MHHLVFTTDCDDYGSWKQNCINYIVGKLYFLGQRYDPLHSLWDIQLMSVHLNNELNIHEVVYLKECQMASQEEQKDVVNLLLTFLVFFFPVLSKLLDKAQHVIIDIVDVPWMWDRAL